MSSRPKRERRSAFKAADFDYDEDDQDEEQQEDMDEEDDSGGEDEDVSSDDDAARRKKTRTDKGRSAGVSKKDDKGKTPIRRRRRDDDDDDEYVPDEDGGAAGEEDKDEDEDEEDDDDISDEDEEEEAEGGDQDEEEEAEEEERVDVKDEAEDWAIGPDDEGKKPCSRGTKMLMTQVVHELRRHMCPPTGGLNGCSKCDRVRSYAPYRLRDVKHACFYYKWDKGWRRAGPTTTASTTEAASGAQGGAGGSSVPQVPTFTPWFDRASWEEERAYEREACDVRVNELTGDALRWDYALTHSLLRAGVWHLRKSKQSRAVVDDKETKHILNDLTIVQDGSIAELVHSFLPCDDPARMASWDVIESMVKTSDKGQQLVVTLARGLFDVIAHTTCAKVEPTIGEKTVRIGKGAPRRVITYSGKQGDAPWLHTLRVYFVTLDEMGNIKERPFAATATLPDPETPPYFTHDSVASLVRAIPVPTKREAKAKEKMLTWLHRPMYMLTTYGLLPLQRAGGCRVSVGMFNSSERRYPEVETHVVIISAADAVPRPWPEVHECEWWVHLIDTPCNRGTRAQPRTDAKDFLLERDVLCPPSQRPISTSAAVTVSEAIRLAVARDRPDLAAPPRFPCCNAKACRLSYVYLGWRPHQCPVWTKVALRLTSDVSSVTAWDLLQDMHKYDRPDLHALPKSGAYYDVCLTKVSGGKSYWGVPVVVLRVKVPPRIHTQSNAHRKFGDHSRFDAMAFL